LIETLDAYFAGCIDVLAGIEIATGGTPSNVKSGGRFGPFQREPQSATANLPGELGESRASRVVGAANGANPIAIVMPCHRVIGANIGLASYAGGLLRKQWLLEHEASFSTRAACQKVVSKTADHSECPRV
jgi:methylated-DNA-[protein]-cysteine S-methyltransferase